MFCVVACLLIAGVVSAAPQELRRAVPPKSSMTVDPEAHRLDQLVLKFAEGSGVCLVRGVFESTLGRDLSAVTEILGARSLQSFFLGQERELRELRQRVLLAMPEGVAPPADLSLYFTVETSGIEDSRTLLRALRVHKIVELAYPKEKPTPPPVHRSAPGDIFPLTPSLVTHQGYRALAPDGVDARAMRSLVGAWGEGVTILDIEWGWYFDHEDLARLRPSALIGPPVVHHGFDAHGVAVMGEISGDPDEFGVTGLVPDAQLLCVTDYPSTGYSVAKAIVTGLPHLQRGDILLLEAQTRNTLGLGPTEFIQADFDAIQNATRLGIVTVEAAGNGGVNLDHATFNGMFQLSVRDSGAIIVGATEGKSLTRASFSTYGSRVDANGWGRQVASTGYGSLWITSGDRRQAYTGSFSGTSSASPMVTSVVAALLGAARKQRGLQAAAAMDFREIRRLLRSHGTQLPNVQQPIGRRPDMAVTLAAAGLERGLRVLDDAVIGKPVRLEYEAEPAVTSSDFWVLIAAYKTDLALLPAPFTGSGCNLLLLDLSNAAVHASGRFKTGSVHTEVVMVPALAALVQKRLYWQAITLRSTGFACASNSVMTFIQR